MSANFTRFSFLMLNACFLVECTGGEPSVSTFLSNTQTVAALQVSPVPRSSSRGTRIDSSTPDGTVNEAMQAIQDNEFERVWELLPKNYQTDVNDLFKEFGNQVDAEMWDKSFVLLNRYISVLIAKEDMLYQTPEVQQSLGMLKNLGETSGDFESEALTPENIKKVSASVLSILTSLLNSELSSSKKLKSFDGRVFCARTLNPLVVQFKEVAESVLNQTRKMGGLPGGRELPGMFTSQDELVELMSTVKVRKESIDGDFAVVIIEANGQEQKQNFIRVDGKWVPESIGASFRPMLGFAKAMIPTYAAQINAQKPKVMPALAQIEPLIEALQKAKTQEEFNAAYANFNSQAPQLVASALGMPGLDAMLGGGKVKVSPVTIEFQGEITDAQLGAAIEQLEALTDNPEQAISLPKKDLGQVRLEITPVSDPQAFASSIKFAKSAEFDAARKTIVIELEPLPAQVETPATEK